MSASSGNGSRQPDKCRSRQELIREMQERAASARSRWRHVMFVRMRAPADARELDEYERDEAEAREAMVSADLELLRLTGDGATEG